MNLTHAVSFHFALTLPQAEAIDFVRDVAMSLSKASFMHNLEVIPGSPVLVNASLPVNAALFGQHLLDFRSLLIPTPKGARLEALPVETSKAGWAEVSGEAVVQAAPQGSQVAYHFDITIHLNLPKPEKWGGKALSKMIEYTAQCVLENISSSFPSAVQAAAKEVEAKFAT